MDSRWQNLDFRRILGESSPGNGHSQVKATQKGDYPDLRAALVALGLAYGKLLQRVRKVLPPKSTIVVHPVPNVLKETRFLTVAFNSILQDEPTVVKELAKSEAKVLRFPSSGIFQGDPNVGNMSAEELMDLELLPELTLDGTHMHPSYVNTLLEPALLGAGIGG